MMFKTFHCCIYAIKILKAGKNMLFMCLFVSQSSKDKLAVNLTLTLDLSV